MFQVFVYGTLLPGQSNHRLIEQYVVHHQHGQVGAILFDNGFYPYAILSQNHVTLGEWLSFRGEDGKTVMHLLDQLEGYRGQGDENHYHRVTVRDREQSIEGFMYVIEPDSPLGQEIVQHHAVIVSGDWNDRHESLYFAYGSCMVRESFLSTCPDATWYGIGELHHHRVIFATNHYRIAPSGVATVIRDEKEKTLGVLWRITFHDLSALRRREGAPFVYSEMRGYVFATITLKDGVSLQVKVPVLYYLLNEPWVERKPTKEYLAMVESGRKGWLKVIKSTIDG